jgi:hypothetical protein
MVLRETPGHALGERSVDRLGHHVGRPLGARADAVDGIGAGERQPRFDPELGQQRGQRLERVPAQPRHQRVDRVAALPDAIAVESDAAVTDQQESHHRGREVRDGQGSGEAATRVGGRLGRDAETLVGLGDRCAQARHDDLGRARGQQVLVVEGAEGRFECPTGVPAAAAPAVALAALVRDAVDHGEGALAVADEPVLVGLGKPWVLGDAEALDVHRSSAPRGERVAIAEAVRGRRRAGPTRVGDALASVALATHAGAQRAEKSSSKRRRFSSRVAAARSGSYGNVGTSSVGARPIGAGASARTERR